LKAPSLNILHIHEGLWGGNENIFLQQKKVAVN